MGNCTAEITLKDEAATTLLARALLPFAAPGRTLCLWGEVGAGKTFFARHFIQELQRKYGRAEDVPSPTFTLVQTYVAGTLEIWHADLYRISGIDDVYELGLVNAFETSFSLIEWPDRLGDLKPANAVDLTFTYLEDEDSRFCKIECNDQQLTDELHALLEDWR